MLKRSHKIIALNVAHYAFEYLKCSAALTDWLDDRIIYRYHVTNVGFKLQTSQDYIFNFQWMVKLHSLLIMCRLCVNLFCAIYVINIDNLNDRKMKKRNIKTHIFITKLKTNWFWHSLCEIDATNRMVRIDGQKSLG